MLSKLGIYGEEVSSFSVFLPTYAAISCVTVGSEFPHMHFVYLE